jgi:Na+-transporting NADH:ubiquinone oxidoreductase subunit B
MDPLKPLRNTLGKRLWKQVEELEPNFKKGGMLEQLHSTFDGFKTFLFVPPTVTHRGAHIRDAIDLKRTMFLVVIAMIPALLHGIFNVGHLHYVANGMYPQFWDGFGAKAIYGLIHVLPIVIVSYVVGLGIEFAFAQFRGHPINEGFLVSGMLIPLVMPPDIPLWMVAVATAFSVIIVKEAFGGTGMNVLNVALTARVFIFFAYPTYISGDMVWIAGQPEGPDAYSGATVLGVWAKQGFEGLQHVGFSTVEQTAGYTPMDMFLGFIPGSIGETSKLAILLGGIILVWTGIASWRIILSVFVGAFVMGLLLNAMDLAFDFSNPHLAVPAFYHLLAGGLAFGAVFMATDPVTAAQTTTGKYIYGFLIGAISIVIRVLNPAYPEGVMLAVLFMNVFAPLIDHFVIQSNIKRRLARGY